MKHLNAAVHARASLCAGALLGMCAASSLAGDAAREVHGSSDLHSGSGITLAWAVLRGSSEDSTQVVVRVVADASAYRSMTVAGVDPFSGDAKALLAPASTAAPIEFKSPRSRFADLPRTEFRFFTTDPPGAAPALVVYYQGIPDTTPEFVDPQKLAAHLASRTAGARPGSQERKQ